MKKLIALSLAALAGAAFGAYGPYTDELPSESTEAKSFCANTGYVTQTASDSVAAGNGYQAFFTNNVDGTLTGCGKWSESAACPHADTNYYTNLKLVTANPGGNASYPDPTYFTFAGKSLVVGSSGTIHSMSVNGKYPVIPNLFMLGGAQFMWWNEKKPISGKLHVRRSETKPVTFYSNTTFTQPFAMDVDGDANQSIRVYGVYAKSRNNAPRWNMIGDWSRYYGSLVVSNDTEGVSTTVAMNGPDCPMAVTLLQSAVLLSNTNGCLNLRGLTLKTKKKLTIDAGTSWTVGDLVVDEDVTFAFKSRTSSINVANSFAIASGSLTLKLEANPFDDAPDPNVQTINLITFGPAVDLEGMTVDSFVFEGFISSDTSDTLPTVTYALEQDEETGATRLVATRKPIIESNNQAVNVLNGTNLWYDAVSTNGASFWSDGEAVHDSADYLLWKAKSGTIELPRTANATVEGAATANAYVFPGDSLTVNYNNLLLQASAGTLGIIDFKFLNVAANLSLRSFASPPTIDGIATARFLAPMSIAAGKTLTSTAYGSKNLRFEGEISGSGNIALSSYRGASAEATNQGATELLGLNTNFTGRIYVDHAYYTKASPAYTIPNDRVYCKLFTRDGRSLGGPLAAFDFDSLWLRQWGCFIPRESVTLGQANRGVYISDVGQFQVDAGVKLTILNPLTMNGTLNVRAATATGGTLALGGPLRFAANNTLSEVGAPDPADAPTNNVMTVSKVFVQALATNSFDGAALTLKDGAGIALDPCATGDVANCGLVNLRGTLATENAEGKIPVRFEPSVEMTGAEYVVAICTVPSGSALTTASFDVARVKGYAREVTSETDETANTKTFRVKLFRVGFTLMFR